jgi:hypothetical protein
VALLPEKMKGNHMRNFPGNKKSGPAPPCCKPVASFIHRDGVRVLQCVEENDTTLNLLCVFLTGKPQHNTAP